jgi:hypothetical protein
MKKLLVVVNVICVAWILLFHLAHDRSDLIIGYGVRAAGAIMLANVLVPAAALAVCDVLYVVRAARKRRRAAPRAVPPTKPDERISESGEGKYDPPRIRKDLDILLRKDPSMGQYLGKCLSQMDSIDLKQEQLRTVRARNSNHVLDEVEAAVDEAETSLCRNLSRIVDRMVLLQSIERRDMAVIGENTNHIEDAIRRNDEILSLCDVLLTECAGYLDDRNAGTGMEEMKLEAMTESIASLRALGVRKA